MVRNTSIAIRLDADLLRRVDEAVETHRFASRDDAIAEALHDKLTRLDRPAFRAELAKLDPAEEPSLAEEALGEDFREWPSY